VSLFISIIFFKLFQLYILKKQYKDQNTHPHPHPHLRTKMRKLLRIKLLRIVLCKKYR
jgi:uncharacterized membrane protein